jgi:hypothetical protein
MTNFRSSALALISGAFSLTLLTGCPNAGTQPPAPVTDASASPTAAAPSPTGSGPVVAAPGSAAPTASAAPSNVATSTLRGKVYDEDGATVTGARVRVRSLNTAVPFDSTVDVLSGSYVVNQVPTGTQVEITATKDGWTPRTRVDSLLDSTGIANIVNFGGSLSDQEDPEGVPFFISDHPEITSASATRTAEKLTYVIKLSEPLDATNRRRFENAMAITATDRNGGIVALGTDSTFLGDRVRATASWDETGSVMTYTFEAPLLAKNDADTTYRLALTRAEGDEVIEDAAGNVLGQTVPAAGAYAEAFKLASPVAPTTESAAARWAAAHTGTASFEVPEDDTKPTLVSVTGAPITTGGTSQFRFSLTFSEPMRVFPEATGFSATVTELNNYYFALSEDEVGDLDMDTNSAATVSDATTANAALDANTVFRFGAGTVQFSDSDPKVVHVSVDRSWVPADARFVKVRVDNVEDPAGNVISTGGKVASDLTADNIKGGAI